jgi:hypothetical protein
MRKLVLMICLLGISFSSHAQGKLATWGNLSRIHAGDKIQVQQTNSKKITGEFVDVSDAAISLQAKAGPQTIQKQDVLRVTLMKNKHRLRNTLILAGVGAGAGAGIAAATFHPCPPSQTFCLQFGGRSLPAGIGAVVGLLAGAGIGALLPSHETVYTLNAH